MSDTTTRYPTRHGLSAAILAGLLLPMAGTALAQDSTTTDTTTTSKDKKATDLDKVVVTGSLIPQTELETASPVTVITAEDIHARGYTSIADVVQSSSFASGGVQGGETSASFTQGAEAVSMFGLDPGYTKYLINGRPMSNYPALYNGSDVFNNISGIPIDAVDRVEILPGGASSLYGSDALAGVVNFILKKDYEGTTLNVRGGDYTEGGGSSMRVSLTHGFHAFDDRLNGIVSLQYETKKPIWGYQRDLTDSVNQDGYTSAVASRDYLVYGYQGISTYGFSKYGYVLPDAADDCSGVTSQFGGTEALQYRSGYGYYCGSQYSTGYRTIKNGKDSGQLYSHLTFDVNDNLQLYGDLLYSHEATKYATGSNYTWWGTSAEYGYYYDPNYDALLNLQRAFSPEDIGGGGYKDIMNTVTTDTYTLTLGAKGTFGESSWDYDVGFTRNEQHYKARTFERWTDAINSYFSKILGEQQGWDPYYGAYPVFTPDYAAFYSTISAEDLASFTGYATSKAKTWDDTFRAQTTNTSLFSLPGGDAGLAVALEVGNEGWNYSPDPRSIAELGETNSETWGSTDVSGAGHRTKYAGMAELRLPIFSMLTADLSGRYDAFDAYGTKVHKPTWSAGLEFRPVQSLLVRAKYGTAFKAPTLADMFQGLSGSYSYATDYYRCGQAGYTPDDTEGCAYDSVQYFNQQKGNTDLKPITAKTWNAGIVWAPIDNLSLSADYYHWDIENEVDQLSTDQVLLQEYYCRSGATGPGIIPCSEALSWVTRGSNGALQSVYTPKVNIAEQWLDVVTASAKYRLDVGRWGQLAFSLDYTRTLKHELQSSPDQPKLDVLHNAYYNWVYDAGPSNKSNASATWNIGNWSTTATVNRLGSTPNYLAYYYSYYGYSYGYTNAYGASSGKWAPYITYNLGIDYRAMDNLTVSFQVNNLLNKMPDDQASNYPGTSTVPYNNSLYSAYGRSVYLQFKYDFGAKVN